MIPLAFIFAAAEFGAPLPTPPAPAPAAIVRHVETTDGNTIPAHESVIASTMTFSFDADGWVTYADGTRRCVATAPCGHASNSLTPDQYTYNFETGVYYAADITHEDGQ